MFTQRFILIVNSNLFLHDKSEPSISNNFYGCKLILVTQSSLMKSFNFAKSFVCNTQISTQPYIHYTTHIFLTYGTYICQQSHSYLHTKQIFQEISNCTNGYSKRYQSRFRMWISAVKSNCFMPWNFFRVRSLAAEG